MNAAAVGEPGHPDLDRPERMCHTVFRGPLLLGRIGRRVGCDPARERHKGPGKTRAGQKRRLPPSAKAIPLTQLSSPRSWRPFRQPRPRSAWGTQSLAPAGAAGGRPAPASEAAKARGAEAARGRRREPRGGAAENLGAVRWASLHGGRGPGRRRPLPGYGERRAGRAESHPRARGEKLCAQRRTRYSVPSPLRPCTPDFSRDLQGRTRSAAGGASQVTGKVGVALHQGLCGAARRPLALALGGSPRDGGPMRRRLSPRREEGRQGLLTCRGGGRAA